jgi:hypothetical protein
MSLMRAEQCARASRCGGSPFSHRGAYFHSRRLSYPMTCRNSRTTAEAVLWSSELTRCVNNTLVPTRPQHRLELLASAVKSSRGVSLAKHAPRLCRAESCGYSTQCSTLPLKVHLLSLCCSQYTYFALQELSGYDSAARIARSGRDHRELKFRALHGKSVPGRNRTRPVGFVLRVICGMVCSFLPV